MAKKRKKTTAAHPRVGGTEATRDMKIEVNSFGMLSINVQTESRGVSATNQYVKDPDTEVYFGGLHACVTFKDLRIEVTMNPDKGDWKNAAWARAQAWKVVCQQLTATAFQEVMAAARAQGHQEGVEKAQSEFRKALGMSHVR